MERLRRTLRGTGAALGLCSLAAGCAAGAGYPGHDCGLHGSAPAGSPERPRPPPRVACPGGFEASFVQIGERELSFGVPEWQRDLGLLRSIGIDEVILQYSGDERGAFDGRAPGSEPVRALLAAAESFEVSVRLGLYADPRWPEQFPIDSELPRPLDRPAESAHLAETCASSPACVGWYLPLEIDDRTWAREGRTERLGRFLDRTADTLRGLGPKHIALAPFFTGTLAPPEHAQWWAGLLAHRPVDAVMLQDGAGSGYGGAEAAERMLAALRPVTAAKGIDLWSTVELFRIVHGQPRDALPFEAVPAAFEDVRRSAEAARAAGARLGAFAVLNYMDPSRGPDPARLYWSYRAWCGAR